MDTMNANVGGAAAGQDPNAVEEYERPKVHYVCGGKS